MTKVLTDICRAEEKKRQAKKEAEKRAKVDEAITRVAEDLNAYGEFTKRQLRQQDAPGTGRDDKGGRVMRPDLHIDTKRRLKRHRDHVPIPPNLMKEIEAIPASGRLRLGNQSYEIKRHPLGEEYPECDIRREQSVIYINLDHPAYEQGVEEDSVEITVFRAIATRFAEDESDSAEEMYEKLDALVRFHAMRTKHRRTASKPEAESESRLLLT